MQCCNLTQTQTQPQTHSVNEALQVQRLISTHSAISTSEHATNVSLTNCLVAKDNGWNKVLFRVQDFSAGVAWVGIGQPILFWPIFSENCVCVKKAISYKVGNNGINANFVFSLFVS